MDVQKLSLKQCRSYLPARKKEDHKGLFGHVLIVGGDYGMGGACRLAGEAALRSGAGLVSIATRPEHAISIMGSCPELMCHKITESSDLDNLLERATVVVIGPGLGQSKWSKMLFKSVLKTQLPLVVDADALNLLAQKNIRQSNWILTPHPGEASRLLGCSTQQIQQDRQAAIRNLQNRYGGVIVLKGSGTLVLGPTHRLKICDADNPAMATAGLGDILTGMIAALLAQQVPLENAAALGVCAHAIAGDQAAQDNERGLIARDLMLYIRSILGQKSFQVA